MNEAYRELVASRVRGSLDAANAMAGVSHQGLKGQLRETLIRDLFRPLFFADVGLGTGQIVTADNRLSPQIDVIVYDRRILPAILFDGQTGLFPIEAVTTAIEVKSCLTASELKDAVQSAALLHELSYLSGIRDHLTGKVTHHSVERVVSAIFALDTDLTHGRKSELQRLLDLDGANGDSVRCLCVVGRGYWFMTGDQWYEAPRPYEGSEVVAFLASISDTIDRIASTRHRPALAQYLFPGEAIPIPGRDAVDLNRLADQMGAEPSEEGSTK